MHKHEILFQDYLKSKSKQSKKYIAGFQECNEHGVDIAIKINLKDGNSLRVHYNGNNIECN